MARIPKAELERLKAEVSIERLAQARGMKLVRKGRDLFTRCFLGTHPDSEASLAISPEKNVWHCFGCDEGGSVIEWVQRIYGVSFRHAIELLRADLPAGDAPTAVPAEGVKRCTVKKLPPLSQADADDQALLAKVVEHYHQELKKCPEALAYLKSRGIESPEAVDRFRLGFVNKTLGYRVPDKGRVEGSRLRGRLQALGILRSTGYEFFGGCLVFPIFSPTGQVVQIYGRRVGERLPPGTYKHLYLPRPMAGVWNLEGLKGCREVILCEALIDALTFWAAGFTNVTTAYGVHGVTPDHWEAFKALGTERVLIAYDRDKAGERAAEALAPDLAKAGLEVFRVQFPSGMDVNSYACKVTPARKSLELILRNAIWVGQGKEPRHGPGWELPATPSALPYPPLRPAMLAPEPAPEAKREAAKGEEGPARPKTGPAPTRIAPPRPTPAPAQPTTTPTAVKSAPPVEVAPVLVQVPAPVVPTAPAPTPPTPTPALPLAAGSAEAAAPTPPTPKADVPAAPSPIVPPPHSAPVPAPPPGRSASEPAPAPLSPAPGPVAPAPPAVSAAVSAPAPAAAPAAPAVPEHVLERQDDELWMRSGDRTFRVRGMEKNLARETLKVSLLVSRPDGRFHMDSLDLRVDRQRTLFIERAGDELGLQGDTMKREVGRLLLALETEQSESTRRVLTPTPHVAALAEADREAALALLRSPDLLDQVLRDFGRCGVIGEEGNKLLGYLAAVSRKLESPLAVVIQSSSAAGKSSLMEAVLKFMPEEEQVTYSAMTGQALFYMKETGLAHKILAIAEEEGAQRASYALKLLQSEGVLVIAATGKDPATGKLVTHEYRVEGPVMLFLTTTKYRMDEELQNRCLVLSVDESRAQTGAIHKEQRRRQTLQGLLERKQQDKVVARHRNAQRMLRPLAVVNPFAEELTFLDHQTRTRRDHMKYLTLINAIALLHQFQREVKTARTEDGETVEYIEVTRADIARADALMGEALGHSLDELAPPTRRLLKDLVAWVEDRCRALGLTQSEYRFTRRDVREWSGLGNTQLKEAFKQLEEMEYLVVHAGSRGHSLVYELAYPGPVDGGTEGGTEGGAEGEVRVRGGSQVASRTEPAASRTQVAGKSPQAGARSDSGMGSSSASRAAQSTLRPETPPNRVYRGNGEQDPQRGEAAVVPVAPDPPGPRGPGG